MSRKQIIIKLIIILLGMIALLLFIIPLMRSSYLNIGSVTGIICSLILLLYGLFFVNLNLRILWLWNKKAGRMVCVVAIILLTALAGTVVVETGFMIKGAHEAPLGDETVVVLGCRVYGNEASLSMVERLDVAYEFLQNHPESKCILSGGQGDGELISEAQCMFNYLTKKGIDSSRLFLEDQSLDTFENLTNTKEIIEEKSLNPKIAIVTSEYHSYRSSLIADELGISHASIPSRTAWWLLPTYYVRELYGILHQWIFGR